MTNMSYTLGYGVDLTSVDNNAYLPRHLLYSIKPPNKKYSVVRRSVQLHATVEQIFHVVSPSQMRDGFAFSMQLRTVKWILLINIILIISEKSSEL